MFTFNVPRIGRDKLKFLQAMAAVAALCTTIYTIFIRDYIHQPTTLATGYTAITCRELVVIDGDTVRCDGIAMREMGDGAPYKMGVDAPAVGGRAKCEKERVLGEEAKLRMGELITDVLHIEDSGARDPSGRPLIKVRLQNGRTAGSVLISEGLAVVWTPSYKPTWCE